MPIDYTSIAENINVNLLLLVIYIGVLSAFVEGTVELFKTPLKHVMKGTPEKRIEKLEIERTRHLQRSDRILQDEGLKSFYNELADDTLKEIRAEWEKKMDVSTRRGIKWFNIVFPIIIGVSVVVLFYPYTLFTFLPFGPQNELIGTATTAVLVGRGSNGAHGAWNKLGGLFESLIGRISPRF